MKGENMGLTVRELLDTTIEEVWKEMCDDYCRYPREWDEEKEGKELYTSEICEKCPLNRL